MLAAVIGDTIGSVFEWANIKTTEFPLFSKQSQFTDDSVMTLAVAEALSDAKESGKSLTQKKLVKVMREFGRLHEGAGYGGMFNRWLHSAHPQPYNSYGNGSAMRVSAVGWVTENLDEAEELARLTAEVTHNHPEGVKGAQAVAGCIVLARQGASNDDLRTYVRQRHGYALDFTLDQIRPSYYFDVTCQGSVPQAIQAFLESTGFEDAIRLAISIGGDSDTIAAITASIAQARYDVPAQLEDETRKRLTPRLLEANDRFCKLFMNEGN